MPALKSYEGTFGQTSVLFSQNILLLQVYFIFLADTSLRKLPMSDRACVVQSKAITLYN